VAKREVRVGEQTFTFDDNDFQVEPAGEGVYVVSDGATRLRVVVAGPPEDCWVFVDGRVAAVEIVDTRDSRPHRIRTTSHEMSAPMPATVVKVLVEPQARVTKGDTILILEAMKMELPVRAARDGVVRKILCAPGELVQPGVDLVEID
jgi:3-methylcrotonyl-CoA carboxylase alpha subunit